VPFDWYFLGMARHAPTFYYKNIFLRNPRNPSFSSASISAIIPVKPHPERDWKYAQSAKRKNYESNKYAKKGELG
jgi:hypothetical protein